MKINSNTKIAAIIKEKPNAIDVIATINKHFRKLQNPILRRTLAKRVTIADASKIGGVSVEVFFEKLEKIGFEIERGNQKTLINKNSKLKEMELDTKSGRIIDLDVRPNIEAGNDPFQVIMAAIKELKDGDTLKIINTFEPIPLINILNKKGYQSKVERPEPGVILTFFKKGSTATSPINTSVDETGSFEEKRKEFGTNLKEIDVRSLEMPEPMVRILSEIEILPPGHGLFVHHKKMPQFLLPELKTRGVKYVSNKINAHNIDFIFFK